MVRRYALGSPEAMRLERPGLWEDNSPGCLDPDEQPEHEPKQPEPPASDCCGYPFAEPGWPDNDICSHCGEHAILDTQGD